MSMVDVLLHHGVQPIVVLDGDKMPAKGITEEHRQRYEIKLMRFHRSRCKHDTLCGISECSSRTANRERGRQLAAAGNTRAAMEMYQRAVEVTPQMARAFMEVLNSLTSASHTPKIPLHILNT